jgi:hypothetical protein
MLTPALTNGTGALTAKHRIRISNDGLVYVGDRVNNRIQVFTTEGKFVREGFIERKTSTPEGTAFDVASQPTSSSSFSTCPMAATGKCRFSIAKHSRYSVSSVVQEATAPASSTT